MRALVSILCTPEAPLLFWLIELSLFTLAHVYDSWNSMMFLFCTGKHLACRYFSNDVLWLVSSSTVTWNQLKICTVQHCLKFFLFSKIFLTSIDSRCAKLLRYRDEFWVYWNDWPIIQDKFQVLSHCVDSTILEDPFYLNTLTQILLMIDWIQRLVKIRLKILQKTYRARSRQSHWIEWSLNGPFEAWAACDIIVQGT